MNSAASLLLGLRGCALACFVSTGCSDSYPSAERTEVFANRYAELSEQARIDGYEHRLVPVRPNGIVVSRDGIVAVGQIQDRMVRFFGPEGEALGDFGRAGRGPGEFRTLSRMGWLSDTLWVYDSYERRLTLVGPDRQLAGIIPSVSGSARPQPQEFDQLPSFRRVYIEALDVNHTVLAEMELDANEPAPVSFPRRPMIGRMTVDGYLHGVATFLPEYEGGFVVSTEGRSASVPFQNWPQVSYTHDGRLIAVVMASVNGPDAGTFSATTVDPTGDTLFARRYAFDVEPLAASLADSVLRRLADASEFPDIAKAIRDAPVPSIYPPFTGLIVGEDSTLWIEHRDGPEGRAYYVLGKSGDPIGVTLLSGGSQVAAASAKWIWAIERDHLDVPSIVRYAVRWK